MKNITNELAAHLAGEVTSLATCWKLTRCDGTVFGFTDHDADIIIDSITYKAASGFTPSAIKNNASLNIDNLDIEGMLSAGNITETDIMAGIYDFAEIEIFMVNYNGVMQGKLKLRRGWLGEVSLTGKQFVAEVRGLTQKLSQTIGDIYSPSCRASFADARCKINAGLYTVAGTVTAIVSNKNFSDSGRSEASGIYNYGKITFTSGENSGIAMEVKEFTTGGKISLVLPMPYDIAIGDSYSMTRGCDKTIATCYNQYNNAINFRGEPFVPGLDAMLVTAGTMAK